MSTLGAVQVAGAVLATAVLLGTIVSRVVPFGAWRRAAEDYGIILGCAAPALALLGPYLRHRLWPGAALIGLALGAAEAAVRPAYHRTLARRVRDIGH